MEKYYCPKCEDFVDTEIGEFIHPDLGKKECRICAKCKSMVYLKDDEGKIPA
jgi:hypothetical protein